MIYADNAATTKMSKAAIDAMLPYMEEYYGNPSSLYAFGQQAKEALENARSRIAACLHADPREVTFTSGGSEADNQAIMTAAALGMRRGKKHIVSTAFEHHAVLHTLEKLKKQGFEVTLLDVHNTGLVRPEQVAEAIREDTCLVTIMYANNEIGTIQPVTEIGAICREKGVLFHTDAVQAAGHLHIDVKEQNIDMLSLSAHKFHGPKGIGALYAKRGIILETIINGGAQERGKRAGTENIPAIMGMAAALEEACAAMDEHSAKLTVLRERLIHGLDQIPYSELNGDHKHRLPGNVNFCFEGASKVNRSCFCWMTRVSALPPAPLVQAALLIPVMCCWRSADPHEVAHGSLRLSLGEDMIEADIDEIILAVTDVVNYLRNISPFWRDLVNGKRPHIFER